MIYHEKLGFSTKFKFTFKKILYIVVSNQALKNIFDLSKYLTKEKKDICFILEMTIV